MLKVWVSALVLALTPVVATAQAQRVTDPPPPATIDDAGVQAWIDQYVSVDGWEVIGADEIAVALIKNEPMRFTPGGHPVAQIRHEYYRPSDFGGTTVRSNFQVRIFNCQAMSQQIRGMAIFEHNNLTQNHGFREFSEAAEWSTGEARSLKARTIAAVCQLARQNAAAPRQ